ncbi:MAG: hypothetical protein R3318_01705 [Gammaproteobacteria bacterium]|nr:hypothetical protein [Gammaproteobacteria bacterium]
MKLTTYFRKYFLSDLVILAVFAVLIYLPGKVFASENLTAPNIAMSTGEVQGLSQQ